MDEEERYNRRLKFRALAEDYAKRARSFLSEADERAAVYAALEVRFGLEALIYDLACVYLDELGSPEALDWQPTKLLESLLEIDPHADNTAYIHQVNEETGERTLVGVDNRLDLKKLKRRYYSISSALHAPTISRMESGKKQDPKSLRKKCSDAVDAIEKVLSSTAFVMESGQHQIFVMDCACGASVRRRTDALFAHKSDPTKGAPSITVSCTGCLASYQISLKDEHFEILQDWFGFNCPHVGCGGLNHVWQRQMHDGHETNCTHCGNRIRFTPILWPVVADATSPAAR